MCASSTKTDASINYQKITYFNIFQLRTESSLSAKEPTETQVNVNITPTTKVFLLLPHKLGSMPLSEMCLFHRNQERNKFCMPKYVIEFKKVSHSYTPGSYQYNQSFLLPTEQLHWSGWGLVVVSASIHLYLYNFS